MLGVTVGVLVGGRDVEAQTPSLTITVSHTARYIGEQITLTVTAIGFTGTPAFQWLRRAPSSVVFLNWDVLTTSYTMAIAMPGPAGEHHVRVRTTVAGNPHFSNTVIVTAKDPDSGGGDDPPPNIPVTQNPVNPGVNIPTMDNSTIAGAIFNIAMPILSVVAGLGALLAIYLGVKLATAQDESRRKEAKAQMVYSIIAVIIVSAMIGIFYALI